jgi:hypothetical protein
MRTCASICITVRLLHIKTGCEDTKLLQINKEIYDEKEFFTDDSGHSHTVIMRNGIQIYLDQWRCKIPGRNLQQFPIIPIEGRKA